MTFEPQPPVINGHFFASLLTGSLWLRNTPSRKTRHTYNKVLWKTKRFIGLAPGTTKIDFFSQREKKVMWHFPSSSFNLNMTFYSFFDIKKRFQFHFLRFRFFPVSHKNVFSMNRRLLCEGLHYKSYVLESILPNFFLRKMKIFFHFSLLSCSVCSIWKYCLYFKMAKLKSKN